MSQARGLKAIMFTDVAGYSALMSADESSALAVLARQRKLLQPLIASHGGTFHKEIGDGALATFSSAVDALQCAQSLQAVLSRESFKIRIGLHLGDVVVESGDVLGDGVNLASRIEPLAEPCGIGMSEDFQHAIRSQPGVVTRSLGEKHLKGIAGAVEIFALVDRAVMGGTATPKRQHSWVKLAVGAAVLAVWVTAVVVLRPWDSSVAPAEPSTDA